MSRDTMARIVNNPWWIVVGVVVSGAVYATRVEGEIGIMREKVVPLTEIRRELDSLRIEQRHIGRTVDEIRHLLGRQQ
jgi:hypothetical protein